MLPQLTDALLTKTFALPGGAATSYSGAFKVNEPGYEFTPGNAELLVEAPALTTGQLPDGQTVAYSLEQSLDEAFTTPVALYGVLFTQTGAGGAGAAAANDRVRLPLDVLPYVRLKAVKTGAASAAAKSASIKFVF